MNIGVNKMDEFSITDETPMIVKSSDNWALRRADIVFIIDCTRTMETTLKVVVNTIEDVVGVYEKANVKIRLALTEFRDCQYPEDNTMGRNLLHHHNFTTKNDESYFTEDVEAFSKILGQLKALGGGPIKESCFDALVSSAENIDWDAGSDRVLVFFSDAEPRKRDELVTKGVEEASERLKNSGINQIHLVIDKKKFEKNYIKIMYIPNPSNPEEEDVPGGIYDIYHAGKQKHDGKWKPSYEGLKKVLMLIARTSGSIVAGSRSSNPFITSGFKRKRKLSDMESSSNDDETTEDGDEDVQSSGNPYV